MQLSAPAWILTSFTAVILATPGFAQTQTTAESTRSATLGDKVDAGVESTKKGAKKGAEWTQRTAAEGWDATKKGSVKAVEWTKEQADDAWDATKSGTGKAVGWTKEQADDAWDATKSGTAKVGEKTREGYEAAKEKIMGSRDTPSSQ